MRRCVFKTVNGLRRNAVRHKFNSTKYTLASRLYYGVKRNISTYSLNVIKNNNKISRISLITASTFTASYMIYKQCIAASNNGEIERFSLTSSSPLRKWITEAEGRSRRADGVNILKVLRKDELDKKKEKVEEYVDYLALRMRLAGIDKSQQGIVIYIHGFGRDLIKEMKKINDSDWIDRPKRVIDKEFDPVINKKQKGVVLTCDIGWESWGGWKSLGGPAGTADFAYNGIVPDVLVHLVKELQKHDWKQISIIAHSMGNYILLNTINKLIKESDEYFDFSKFQFVSCAAAVDIEKLDKTLKLLERYKNSEELKKKLPKKWTSYFHEDDLVLSGWDKIDGQEGMMKRNLLGRVMKPKRNVTNMIDCIDCTGLWKDVHKLKHSYNFENRKCLIDLKELLVEEKLNINDRSGKFKKVGNHWKFEPEAVPFWRRLF